MDNNLNHILGVEDFNQHDFDDPIKLLEAITTKRRDFSAVQDDLENYINIDEAIGSVKAYSLVDVSRKLEVPIRVLRSAVETGALKMSAYMPLITLEEAKAFVEGHDGNALFTSFMYEVQNMRTNYSYKPVLLLALLQKSNEAGESDIGDIVDYFLGFYEARKAEGLIVEKGDSAFMKNPLNRGNAKATIIRYPVAVFADKQFLKYDRNTGVIAVSPLIWENLSQELRQSVTSNCVQALQKYYDRL